LITGITGEVSIDENGDRNGDYSLLDMNKTTGHFEVTTQFRHRRRWVPRKVILFHLVVKKKI